MKTRAIKFLLPVMAIVFAVAASAFTALDTPKADENTLITGYIPTGNPLEPCDDYQVDCNLDGNFDCTISGVDYYQLNGTSCDMILKRDNP